MKAIYIITNGDDQILLETDDGYVASLGEYGFSHWEVYSDTKKVISAYCRDEASEDAAKQAAEKFLDFNLRDLSAGEIWSIFTANDPIGWKYPQLADVLSSPGVYTIAEVCVDGICSFEGLS